MRYLVVRLTSLGSVAMSVPVMWSLSRRYADNEYVYVAQKDLDALFHGMNNVHYVRLDVSQNANAMRRGKALKALAKTLHNEKPFDAIIDWQSGISTLSVRLWAMRHGIQVYRCDSTWFRQRIHILSHGQSVPPPTMIETYMSATAKAGLETDSCFQALPIEPSSVKYVKYTFGDKSDGEKWIGIAPFAKSASNTLPFRTTKSIIRHYASQPNTRVFLFGAGMVESEMLNQWSSIYVNVVSVAGMLSLGCELELMRMLDGMICMDSANQHLASLVGLRVVTVWGGTTPENGFAGWKQSKENFVEPQCSLTCRPCTINGRARCRKKTFECLTRYTAQQIIGYL